MFLPVFLISEMYTKYWNREELQKIVDELKYYKLCYIEEISQTIWDDTPETKKFKETEEYKKLFQEHEKEVKESIEKTGHYVMNPYDEFYSHLESQEYPNPEYIPEKFTHFAYFTPRLLKNQWGDDWDDKPYDCNAEKPYDNISGDGTVDIIIIPFYLTDSMQLPCSGYLNCPFSVEDINNGAIAWIYNRDEGYSIQAGTNPQDFIDIVWKKED